MSFFLSSGSGKVVGNKEREDGNAVTYILVNGNDRTKDIPICSSALKDSRVAELERAYHVFAKTLSQRFRDIS